ncbi:hypothetical protein PYCC9005_000958 [Savitreella phatthalungensis]
MSTFTSIHLRERPAAEIRPDTFEERSNPAIDPASLKDGQLLVRVDYLSIDPAMRGWLNDARSYVPPVGIGEVMRSGGVATVVASKSSRFSVGESVNCTPGWTEYAVIDAKTAQKLPLAGKGKIVARDYLSVLGMTSLTAYFGMTEVAKLTKPSTVVVSGAAGATGLAAGQIAKILGHRVVGIAGSQEKCDFLKSVGFDDAVSYKSKTFWADLKRATPNYIDCFFDNVGGDILDACLKRAAQNAVFVICGAISQYEAGKDAKGPAAYTYIISMRIRMQGFIVFDYAKDYPRALAQMAQWYEQGKMVKQETVVKGGLRKAPGALSALFKSANTGKMMVEVTSPDHARL